MAKKILIVNVNWVGDVLFSTPFIRAVRSSYPDSHIACLLHPRCVEMLEGNPRLDEIIIYDEELRHKSLMGKLKLIGLLRKKNFDIAFILHRSFTKALVLALAGIRDRIGYPTKNRAFLLTKAASEPSEETHPALSKDAITSGRKGGVHKVEYFLDVARASGIEVKSRSYEFFIKNTDRDFIKEFLRKNGVGDDDLLIVICPGGNWEPKRWPSVNFATLSDLLMERFGAKVVISGAKKDIGLAEDIRTRMKGRPIIACGKTTLKQLAALLEMADLVIANDTGPMHIAVSMKTKVIALFGPTSPHITGPYGEGNYRVIFKDDGSCEIPCYDVTCKDNSCMSAIRVEDVLREASDMLSKNSKVK